MSWPLSQDYNEAVQTPSLCFADDDLKRGEVAVNALGLPIPRSGNFADVYRVTGPDGRAWAVKCFTRKVAGLRERYAAIDAHLSKAGLPFTVGFGYLPEGVRVRGQWYPLLKMDWVEGFTLNEFVRDNLTKPVYLGALLKMWVRLSKRLRDAEVAHADLQHGNVLLVPGSSASKLGLKLIDYDGMWVPALAGTPSGEVGHPAYQHPWRLRDRLFGPDVDRFPHLVVACALRAGVVAGEDFFRKHDNGDNLLFREEDLRNPAGSALMKELWGLNDPTVCGLVAILALSANRPPADTPWLDELMPDDTPPALSDAVEGQAADLLGVQPRPKLKPRPAPAPEPREAPPPEREVPLAEPEPEAAPARAAAVRTRAADYDPFADIDDEDEPESPRARPRKKARKPEKKSPLPWFIGGGVGALALVGALVLALSPGKKPAEPTTPEVALNTNTVPPDGTDGGRGKNPKQEPKKTNPGPVIDPIPPKNDPNPAEPPKGNARILRGHGDQVRAVAFHPDGKRAVSGGQNDKEVRLWDLQTGETIRTLTGHEGPVRGVACTPDGKRIVSCSEDRTVRVWDVETGRQLHRLEGHKGAIGCCALTPDGRYAATAGDDGSFHIWDVQEGKLAAAFPAVRASSLAFLPDGRTLLAGTADGVQLWDAPGRERKMNLPGTAADVNAVCVSADGTRAFAGGRDGRIHVWELPDGKPVGSFGGHAGPILSMALSRDGKVLVAGDAAEELKFWEVRTGKELGSRRPGGVIHAVALSPNNRILVGTGRHRIHVLALVVQDPVPATVNLPVPRLGGVRFNFPWIYGQARGKVLGVSPMPGDQLALLVDGEGRALRLIDLPGKRPLRDFEGHTGNVVGLARTSDGKRAVTCSEDGTLRVWDVQTGETVHVLTGHKGAVSRVAVTPDNQHALSVGDDRTVREWDLATGKELQSIAVPPSVSIAAAPDGRTFLLGTRDGPVQLWDLQTRRMEKEFAGHRDEVRDLCFALGGRYAFSCGNDGTIRMWDVAAGREVRRFTGHRGAVHAVAVSADGRMLVSGGEDGEFRVWIVTTGGFRLSVGLKSPVTAVALSADGGQALAGTSGKAVFQIRLEEEKGPKPPPQPSPDPLPADGKVVEAWREPIRVAPDCLAFTPNGKRFVASAGDKPPDIVWYDTDSGKSLGRANAKVLRAVAALSVCPDGTVIGVGAQNDVVAWDPIKHLPKRVRFGKLDGPPRPFSPDPDGKYALVPAPQGQLRIIDLQLGKQFTVFQRHPPNVTITGLRRSLDGKRVVSVGSDAQVLVWPPFGAPGQPLTINSETQSIRTAVPSPDGSRVVGFGAGGTLKVWDGQRARAPLHTLAGHTEEVVDAGFSGDGRLILSLARDRTLRVWETASGKLLQKIDLPGVPSALAIAPDGKSALTATVAEDGAYVQLWRLPGAPGPAVKGPPDEPPAQEPPKKDPDGLVRPLKQSERLRSGPAALAYSGGKLLAAYREGAVRVLNPDTLQEERVVKVSDAGTSVALSPDAQLLTLGEGNKRLQLRDWEKEKTLLAIPAEPKMDRFLQIDLAPDGKTALTRMSGPFLHRWDLSKGKLMRSYRPHGSGVPLAVVHSPVGRHALSGGSDKKVLLLNLDTGKVERVLAEAASMVTALEFSPDRTQVAGGTSDGTIYLWDANTGRTLHTLRGHTKYVPVVRFSPDGNFLLSGSHEDVRLWDARKGEPVWVSIPQTGAWSAAFSPDGLFVATGGIDNRVSLWPVPGKK